MLLIYYPENVNIPSLEADTEIYKRGEGGSNQDV